MQPFRFLLLKPAEMKLSKQSLGQMSQRVIRQKVKHFRIGQNGRRLDFTFLWYDVGFRKRVSLYKGISYIYESWSENIRTFCSFSKTVQYFQNIFLFFFQSIPHLRLYNFVVFVGAVVNHEVDLLLRYRFTRLAWSHLCFQRAIVSFSFFFFFFFSFFFPFFSSELKKSRWVGWPHRGWDNSFHLNDMQALENVFCYLLKLWQGFSPSKSRNTPSGLFYLPFKGGPGVSLNLCCFVVYPTRRFVLSFTCCYFVLLFFSPLSTAITSLGEERANL